MSRGHGIGGRPGRQCSTFRRTWYASSPSSIIRLPANHLSHYSAGHPSWSRNIAQTGHQTPQRPRPRSLPDIATSATLEPASIVRIAHVATLSPATTFGNMGMPLEPQTILSARSGLPCHSSGSRWQASPLNTDTSLTAEVGGTHTVPQFSLKYFEQAGPSRRVPLRRSNSGRHAQRKPSPVITTPPKTTQYPQDRAQ